MTMLNDNPYLTKNDRSSYPLREEPLWALVTRAEPLRRDYTMIVCERDELLAHLVDDGTISAQQAARFSAGELVVIDAPGWLWDRLIATVGSAWRAGAEQRWLYNVTIHWPNGDARMYTVWESQLTSVNDDETTERSGGDGG